MLDELKLNLVRSQLRMQEIKNRKRRDVEFEEGELVYLKLQPYRQKSLARRPFEKLATGFYGSFPVTQRVGKVGYRLQLPPDCKLHQVFHVSQLKQAFGST